MPAEAAAQAVTHEVIAGKLLSIVDEMAIVLARSSMSPVIYEVLDFACGLCDSRGDMVAQTNGITIFTGTFSHQVRFIAGRFGGDMAPGDVFLTNDPFEGGTHACDFAIIRPIFAADAIIAYAIAVAHLLDVGGAVAGSLPPDARCVFQEGLRLSGIRLARGDRLIDDVIRIISENVRLPELALGDINAELAAVRIAERRLLETAGKYGVGVLDDTFRRLIADSEAQAGAVIQALPDGDYHAADVIDGDGASDEPIAVQVTVRIRGPAIEADFTGSSLARPAPVNCSRGALNSAVKTVIKALVGPQAPSNDGWFRPLTVTAPSGTVFTAQKPSPTGWYYESAAQASELVWKALAPLAPARFSAGSYMSLCATYLSGPIASGTGNSATGPGGLFVHIEPQNGGWGATSTHDGASGMIAITDGDTYNHSVELLEAKFPVLIHRYDYNVEAGVGAGRHRGGFGLVREYEITCDDALLYASFGRNATRPWGVAGGGEGSLNGIEVIRGGDSVHLTRTPGFPLERGDRVRIRTGGGGGWGDPAARDPRAVARDVRDGLVTAEAACRIYGCALPPPAPAVRQVAASVMPDRAAPPAAVSQAVAAGGITRVATDAGGTFTDLVAFEEATGRIFVGKALTTPHDPSEGVIETIRMSAATGLAPGAISLFVHGGTTVINAIAERRGARTALVTTRGFRDVIAIGRGNRPDLYNLHSRPAEPFVPRHLRFEVGERMDAAGLVRMPVSLSDVEAVADALAAADVEAVAVVFLHSYINPAHEAAVASRLRARLPGVAVSASHEISRQWREYERSNTAVLSAYVQPVMTRYLANLVTALQREGLACPSYCMQSNGGLATFEAAAAAPLVLVESGPAGGVAGAVRVGEALGEPDILYLDVGGTTAKCSLVRQGRPVLTPDYRLERTRLAPGYPLQVPVVDIIEIGAGGGSIARIDEGGAIRVGPQSAGSEPGPACYGRGGTAPTVTDAKLLTGVIDPVGFAGGRMRLDPTRAAQAFAPLAAHLGVSVSEAAQAVIRLAEANMINALKLATIQRGHDPRDLTMVVSGGGGPMHAATLGRELGVKRVVIPRYAGLFSAWGMLAARPRIDLQRTRLLNLDAASLERTREIFAELEGEAAARFGRPASAILHRHAIEMRYAGQEHTVATPFNPSADLAALFAAFHAAHEQAYTFRLDTAGVELVTFQLASEIDTPRIGMPEIAAVGSLDEARVGSRGLHAGSGAIVAAPVYSRDRLPPGSRFEGPALVDEATSTTMILPGQRAQIDRFGLLLIEEAG